MPIPSLAEIGRVAEVLHLGQDAVVAVGIAALGVAAWPLVKGSKEWYQEQERLRKLTEQEKRFPGSNPNINDS